MVTPLVPGLLRPGAMYVWKESAVRSVCACAFALDEAWSNPGALLRISTSVVEHRANRYIVMCGAVGAQIISEVLARRRAFPSMPIVKEELVERAASASAFAPTSTPGQGQHSQSQRENSALEPAMEQVMYRRPLCTIGGGVTPSIS